MAAYFRTTTRRDWKDLGKSLAVRRCEACSRAGVDRDPGHEGACARPAGRVCPEEAR